MICKCGHPRDQHMGGMCIADCDGDVCSCAAFSPRGKRAKRGRSKRQDVLDRWHRSADAPVGNDPDGGTLGSLIGESDSNLTRTINCEQTDDEYADAVHLIARPAYAKGGGQQGQRKRRNFQRDMEIVQAALAGESTYSLAVRYGISQTRIFMIVSDYKGKMFVAVQDLRNQESAA